MHKRRWLFVSALIALALGWALPILSGPLLISIGLVLIVAVAARYSRLRDALVCCVILNVAFFIPSVAHNIYIHLTAQSTDLSLRDSALILAFAFLALLVATLAIATVQWWIIGLALRRSDPTTCPGCGYSLVAARRDILVR